MFDTASKSGSASRALVALTLADGSVLNAAVRLNLSGKVADTLNSADQFLDVVMPDGEQMFIAKAGVRKARLLDVPKANHLNLQRRSSDRTAFDPHAILKVGREASAEDIRQAYLRMTKLYHPDRLATFELPPEVHDYAKAMQVRINLAYEQIGR